MAQPDNTKLKRLIDKLKELFQLDQPELDFGIYRIMHAKSGEVTQFLERDLLPQVREAFAQYQSADTAELKKKLEQMVASAKEAGFDPDQSPKVAELRKQIAGAVDIASLENEVYDHLYTFFRRYYSEGDFLSKRVYKEGVYAIPYEGEEVKLYWANHDQYYIKTSEYLRDYAFRLRPDDTTDPMRVHCKLVDAAEGEHGNVKAAEGKERQFILASEKFIAEEAGELSLRFEYRPARLEDWPEAQRAGKDRPPSRDALTSIAEQRIFAANELTLQRWLIELQRPHTKSDGEQADYSRLIAHLRRYTARNTFDYFIHKDLGGFLRRELDFYIKNEVMRLDDIENESAPKVEQYLSKIKAIRRIAGKIIDFLAQLEDFQKKLWLKRKFVVETSYCIRLGCIPERFYQQIAANDAQRVEWEREFSIGETAGNLATIGYSVPLSIEFLRAHRSLVLNTRNFSPEFTAALLESFSGIEELIDGLLINSENSQALNLLRRRYKRGVDCVFIDPPYNTGGDGFAYKDEYTHSSWMSMMQERLSQAPYFLSDIGTLWCTLDSNEAPRFWLLGDSIFGAASFAGHLVWQHSVQTKGYAGGLATSHNNIFCWGRSSSHKLSTLERTEENNKAYSNPDNDPKGAWRTGYLVNSLFRPNLRYDVETPSGKSIPPPDNGWRYSKETMASKLASGEIFFSGDETRLIRKIYLVDQEGHVPSSVWLAKDSGSSRSANLDLKAILGATSFSTAKPVELLCRIVTIAGVNDGVVLDYFAGSGSTGHAVIDLNRADAGRRGFILVETNEYFESVLYSRIMRIAYTPEWKDGMPARMATEEEAARGPAIIKVLRLESYEDSLNNLKVVRSDRQRSLLDQGEATGSDRLREQYLLRYQLEVETRESASLLSVDVFTDPRSYKLTVKGIGGDESREINVDMIETFNWLIGLSVEHIAAPKTFTADFERDSEGRLRLKDRLRQETNGQWWFRAVTGSTPEGRKALIIWRTLTGDPERDNAVLEEWFSKQGYSTKDSEFELIYVNGGNTLENLKADGDTWKVRLIEEDFHRLMFDTAGE